MRPLLRRLRVLFRRGRFDRELEEEMRSHLEMQAEENLENSMAAEEADYAARRQFGNTALLKEQSTEAWGWRWLGDLVRDGVGAFRSMRRSPGYAAVVIVTLALAIGANTAIFSFVHVLMLKRLPVTEPERLVLLNYMPANGGGPYNGYSYRFYREIAIRDHAFDGILARGVRPVDLSASSFTGRVVAEMVSGNYFRVLGVGSTIGRLLDEGDDSGEAGLPPVVISYSLWHKHFGADSGILHRIVRLNGHPFQVVGVTEAGFSGSVLGQHYDLQIPLSAAPLFGISLDRTVWLQLMGRLKAGVSLAQARAVTRAVGRQADETFQAWHGSPRDFLLADGSNGFADVRTRLQSPAIVLLAAAGLVLLIACANIAGLLSARAVERRYEMAIRLALGATPGRLIRQLLVESAVLAFLGGCCGLLFARWTTVLLTGLLDNGRPDSLLEVSLEKPVLAATLAGSILASVLFGLLPAWQASRPSLAGGLRQGGFFAAARRGLPIRRVLVVAQVALSIVLLCGAAVVARTLRNLQTVDLGFKPEQVVLLVVNPESNGYSPEASRNLFQRLLEEARRLPGVESAGLSEYSVLSGWMSLGSVGASGFTGSRQSLDSYLHVISPGYLRSLRTPLLAGRDFDDRDRDGSPAVAIVNERFASLCWPGQNPVGKRIVVKGTRDVVGVVKNSNYRAIREKAPLTVYLPFYQLPLGSAGSSGMTLLARVRGNTGVVLGLLQQRVRALDPNLPVDEIRTLETQRDYGISTERTMAFVSVMFATLAATITVVGLAGLIAFGVSSRTKEIGVRMVLGADRLSVVSIFLRETLLLVAVGAVIGLPLAWAALRTLETLVFGMPARDPWTLAVAAALFVVVALSAVIIPVRRAMRVEPVAALREG
jgi:predicted permease